MAYWLQEPPTPGNKKSFMCDYLSDVDNLPRMGIEGKHQDGDTVSSMSCIYGSDCFVIENSSVWILRKDTNEWKEI